MRWMVWAVAGFFRSRTSLIAENLCLRQQLLVLHRKHKRPRLQDSDRRFWILASRWLPRWQEPLLIVTPETVLRWHRKGWKAWWRWRSRPRGRSGRKPVTPEVKALIQRMAHRECPVGPKTHPGGTGKAGLPGVCEDRRQVHARHPPRTSFAELVQVSLRSYS